jgi:hypothetical protein
MNQQSAVDTLIDALTAVPHYENPLNAIYEILSQERQLTLRAIRQHSQLLHDHADLARDQNFAINSVITSCKQIPPTPLLLLPLGF